MRAVPGTGETILDAAELEYIDGAGTSLIHEMATRQRAKGGTFRIDGLRDNLKAFLDLAGIDEDVDQDAPCPSKLTVTEIVGKRTREIGSDVHSLVSYVGRISLEIDWTPTSVYVPSVPSTLMRFQASLDTLLANLAKTDIKGVVAAARDTFREIEKSLKGLDLGGLNQRAMAFLDKAGTTVDGAGKDIDQLTAEVSETLKSIRGSVETTFKSADSTLGKVNKILANGKLEESLERLAGVLAQADSSIKEIRTLTGHTDQAVVGIGRIVRGRSRALAIAIGNLREILDNLNTLTGTLNQYPSLLFLGNPPKVNQKKTKAEGK